MLHLHRKYWLIPLMLIVLAWVFTEARQKNDFDIFLLAANDLSEGKNIYAQRYIDGYHYYYSILFALLLSLLKPLPVYAIKAGWLLLNVFFLYRIWIICTSYMDLTRLSKKQYLLLGVLAFLFMMRFVRDNFHVAQMTICMLYLSLEGLRLVHEGKKIAGSALVALAINIKLLPLVLLPYLFYRREIKAGLFIGVFYFVFLVLPSLFIGHKHNIFLLSEWWTLINPSNKEHVIDVSERSFHGLSTLLPTLLMEHVPDPYALPLKRNIADLTVEQVNLVLNAARLLLIAFMLYFLRTLPFQKAGSRIHILWEISYLFMVVPLIFPHQQHYAFFFTFPAIIYLLYFLMVQQKNERPEKGKLYSCIAAITVIFLVFNSTIILGHFSEYYEHFKILTYAALLLIVPLAVCRPALLFRKALF